MCKPTLLLAAALLLGSAVSHATPKLCGTVVRTNPSAQWYQGSGVYELAADASGTFNKISTAQSSMSSDLGAVVVDNTLYTFYANETPWFSNYIIEAFDFTTFERKPITTADLGKNRTASAMVRDEATGTTYGCFFTSSSTFSFGTIDLPSSPDATYMPTVTPIADASGRWSAMAINAAGEIYAIDATSGMLLKVDKATGNTTEIGNTGLTTSLQSAAVIDKATGKMYYSHTQTYSDVKLYEINLTTGQATLMADWENNPQVTFLYIPASTPTPPAGIPSAAVNLTASFPEGALTGEVTFDIPTTTSTGETGQGDITWDLSINGTHYTGGTATYGAHVTVPVTMEARGNKMFTVTLTTDAGSSEASETSVFAGTGTPSAPQNAKAVLEEGVVTVTWDAVTGTSDGGYFNASKLRYNVWRIDGDNRRLIGEWINRTYAKDNIGIPTDDINYTYAIEAFYTNDESLKSEESLTNTITIGYPVPPYEQEFNTAAAVDEFTIINANEDPFTWQYFRGRMRIQVTGTTNYPMDDWLITPGYRMEKGKMYPVQVDMEGNIGYDEIFEIKAGRNNTVEAMDLTVVAPTILPNRTETYTGYIIPKQTGAHWLGIHAMSDEHCFYIFADNIRIGAGTSAAVPAAVSGLTATPDYSGASNCTITFTLPTLTAEGNPLSGINSVKIMRDGEIISDGPQQTSEITFEDTDIPTGNHTYTVLATNDEGDGIASSVKVFVGVGIPAIPTGASVTEIEEGIVTVTWNPVNTDQDGNTLNPALVTYQVYDAGTGELMADNVTGTSATFTGTQPGTQVWGEYMVYAITTAGRSITSSRTAMIPVGTPYPIPYAESFANGRVSNICGLAQGDMGGKWEIMTDCDMSGLSASDHDNGFATMIGVTQGSSASIYSGKIDLRNSESPVLTFRAFNQNANGDTSRNTIEVKIDDGTGFKPVNLYLVNNIDPDSEGNEWIKGMLMLKAYAGKVICVEFTAVEENFTCTILDDIRIHELYTQDLDLRLLSAPAFVAQNESFTVNVNVENIGAEPAEGWSVELYADGSQIASRQGPELKANAKCDIEFDMSHSPMHNETVEYTAKIVYPIDENPDNDTSNAVSVTLRKNYLPVPTSLAYSTTGGDVNLSWNEPDITTALPAVKADDFESYDGFLTDNIGDWTSTDVDEGIIGTLGSGLDIPGIPDGVGPAAFFTLDVAGGGEEGKLAAHSGTKYAASMYLKDCSQVDDWLISPELYGGEQTITFFAKSYHASYCENIEVLASDSGTATDDFEKIAEFNSLTTAWTEFSVTLPEGSRHFAIRNITENGFMLMVDDISFIPAAEPEALEIIGYNVYLDGTKVNDSPVDGLYYSHNPGAETSRRYTVTCVYDKGESGASNIATPISGISINDNTSVNIYARKGEIVVSNPGGADVEIVTPSGIVIYQGTPGQDLHMPVNAGIYIVRAGTSTAKLTVK